MRDVSNDTPDEETENRRPFHIRLAISAISLLLFTLACMALRVPFTVFYPIFLCIAAIAGVIVWNAWKDRFDA